MAASVEVSAAGLPRLEAVLAGIAGRTRDLSPLMDVIGLAMESSTLSRFEDEEAPDGSKWTPSVRAKEEGGKTLTQSARLKMSIGYVAGPTSVEVGTNVIYARPHQEGMTIKAKGDGLVFKLPGIGFVTVMSVTIPARPFLGISRDDEDEIEALAEEYVLEDAA